MFAVWWWVGALVCGLGGFASCFDFGGWYNMCFVVTGSWDLAVLFFGLVCRRWVGLVSGFVRVGGVAVWVGILELPLGGFLGLVG